MLCEPTIAEATRGDVDAVDGVSSGDSVRCASCYRYLYLGPGERVAEQTEDQTQNALEVAEQAVDQAQSALQKAKQ